MARRARIPRLVIVSLGRSGTELLVGLLDTHPHIRCESEILARHTAFPVAFLEGRAAAAASRGAHAYGVKVLRHHFARYGDGRDLLERLVSRGFVVVVLRRRNMLRQAISHHRAHGSGRFHTRTGESSGPESKLTAQPDEVLGWLEGVERDSSELDGLVAGLASVELWYEDDLATPEQQQATVDRLCAGLGIESAPVTSKLRRSGNSRLGDAFVNAEAIRARLATTRFAGMWDD